MGTGGSLRCTTKDSLSLSHEHTHTERETEKEKAGGEQEGQRKGGERDRKDRIKKEVCWEWPKG